jgi:hypothetical protein
MSQAPPPPRFARFASSSGPPPPLSRGRMKQQLRQSPSLLRHFHSLKKSKEAERRQTRSPRAVPRERMSPLARASGPARAEAQRARLSAFHRGACCSERTPQLNSSDALPVTVLGRSGRYPLPAVLQCSDVSRTGRSAGRASDPEPPGSAADEAAPAGTTLAPPTGITRLASLLGETMRYVTITGTMSKAMSPYRRRQIARRFRLPSATAIAGEGDRPEGAVEGARASTHLFRRR